MANDLSESAWTGFLKKQKLELDDGPLRKALAKVDKTDDSKPQPRLEALKEVVEQLTKQVAAQAKRKKELGDKPFGLVKDQLHAMLAQAEALQKKTQAAAQDEGEEEADTPALLTTKMVPLLRELRKGEAQMHALICTAGKNTALLIMRRAISPSRRKLLADAVDAKGGMKYIAGECVFENKALTFVVASPAAQLAKRLRQALLDQTDMRMKVRVRGEDGVDEDGEDEGDEAPAAGPAAGAPPAPQPASAEQLAYTQRLRKVRDRVGQAQKAQHPESTKLGALMGYASEKADAQKDYAGATKVLEGVEKLLDAPASGGQRPGGESGGADAGAAVKARMIALIGRIKEAQAAGHPGAQDARLKISEAGVVAGKRLFAEAEALMAQAEGFLEGPAAGAAAAASQKTPGAAGKGANVVFQQTRLAWDDTRKQIQAELRKLESSVLSEARGEPDFEQIAGNSRQLYTVLDHLDERLIDKLDDALNAETPQARTGFTQEAREIVDEYIDYVKSDELLRDIDDNGFVDIRIGPMVTERLTAMAAQLRAAAQA